MPKTAKSTKKTASTVKKTIKAAKAPKSIKSAKEVMSKSQIYSYISETAEIPRKDVSLVFEHLSEIIQAHLKKGAAGIFCLPGLLKLYVVRKPATKARKGINPFTKEEVMFKAKPARNVIKARVLKKLKDAVA